MLVRALCFWAGVVVVVVVFCRNGDYWRMWLWSFRCRFSLFFVSNSLLLLWCGQFVAAAAISPVVFVVTFFGGLVVGFALLWPSFWLVSDVVCRSNSPLLLLTLLRVLSSTSPAAPSLSSDCIGRVPSISSPFWLYPFILGRLPGCSLFNQCDVVFGGLCMQRVGVCNYVARVDLVGARGRADCRLVMSW